MTQRYIDGLVWLVCLEHFDGACAYCGATSVRLTADHLLARSKGGGNTADNIVPACEDCNEDKADQEWRDWLLQRPGFSQERMNRIFSWRRVIKQARL